MIYRRDISPATCEALEGAARGYREAQLVAREAKLKADLARQEADELTRAASLAREDLAKLLWEAGFKEGADDPVAFPSGNYAYWAANDREYRDVRAVLIPISPRRNEVEF